MKETPEKIYCPVNGWDCPYWKKGGECTLENVADECSDYADFWSGWDDDVDESNYNPFTGQDEYETEDIDDVE